MVDYLWADFAEWSKGSEGNSNKDVFRNTAIGLFELNLLSTVDVNKLEVGLEVRIALFVVLKSLGDLFFEFGDFGLHRISLKIKNNLHRPS